MSAYLDTSAAAVQAATASREIGTEPFFWNAIPQPIASYNVHTGTRLTFKFSNSHNLYLMASQAKYDDCDFSGARELASTTYGGATNEQDIASGLSNLYEATVARVGTLRFACEVQPHCDSGQKVVVYVTPTSPPSSPPIPALPPFPPDKAPLPPPPSPPAPPVLRPRTEQQETSGSGRAQPSLLMSFVLGLVVLSCLA